MDWLLAGLFAFFEFAAVLGYLPQIVTALKKQGEGLSIWSWLTWSGSNVTGFFYTWLVVENVLLAVIFLGHALGCLFLLGWAIRYALLTSRPASAK